MLAEHLGGIVINADSMQVYTELRVLSARPSAEEEVQAPHRLYGHIAGRDAYSVARWAMDVGHEIERARDLRLRPIIVGGTGLYFKALLEGLSPIPAIPADVRRHWRDEAARLGSPALHRTLAARDPAMAERLAPGDTQRVTRALEVIEATGRSLANWQRQPGVPVLDSAETIRLVVEIERVELFRRCDHRFDLMMEQGALDEVRALAALDLPSDMPILGALGVRPLLAHLTGGMALDAAIEHGKIETRQYAKRQLTWLRRNMIAWKSFSAQLMEQNLTSILSFVDGA